VYPVTIAGPRVLLRDFEPGDLDATLAIVGDPAVTRWLSFDTRGRAEQAERLAQDIVRAGATPPRRLPCSSTGDSTS
jgi:ribosomal-protein-alanine N-acetyltransferase